MSEAATAALRLGLIGDNIGKSLSPRFHALAGAQCGIDVTFERLVPAELNLTAEEILEHTQRAGYRGVNVTYPYKERIARLVEIPDPLVRAMGAVNTVVFRGNGRPHGFNTDYSGFIAAYRSKLGDLRPGTVCLLGTGGVGRAIAFGLRALGAQAIRCYDPDVERLSAFVTALAAVEDGTSCRVTAHDTPAAAAVGAEGILNGSPMGMTGHDGTPIKQADMAKARWIFEAVYTPRNTQFVQDAAQLGLIYIDGVDLFLHQATDAWTLFSGATANLDSLTKKLDFR